MKNRFSKTVLILLAPAFFAFKKTEKSPAEPPIEWRNPSFEGSPERSKCPLGWIEIAPDSTPDLQPEAWNVQSPSAKNGLTYIGLIAREDGTAEDIGQVLPEKLQAGKCYRFSIWVARAAKYSGYDLPLRLRVWGGGSSGQKTQVLATSGPVSNEKWTEFKVQFTAKTDLLFITFEADFAPGTLHFYKGNILIDHLSPIEKCERA